MELILEYEVALDRGLVRQRNEDRCGAFPPADDALQRAGGRLFVLADGMGGHPAGDLAAEIAVQTIREAYFRAGGADPAAGLREAFHSANNAILDAARGDGRHGMGTAAVAAAIVRDRMTVAHLGDCRCYLLRGARATRLTCDHSFAQAWVDIGRLTAAEARVHPYRKVLTRTLGSAAGADPAVQETVLLPGDRVVLCSDGLWSMAEDDELARVVGAFPTAADAARALINLALVRGGPDDMSVIVVRVIGWDTAPPAARRSLRSLCRAPAGRRRPARARATLTTPHQVGDPPSPAPPPEAIASAESAGEPWQYVLSLL